MALSQKQQEKYTKTLRTLLQEPANRVCFDCPVRGNNYGVLEFNIFVCQHCAGIHRQFNHRVKGIGVANFSAEEVRGFELGGNEVGKKIWLGSAPSKLRTPDSKDDKAIEAFIKDVFVRRKYYSQDAADEVAENAEESSKSSKPKLHVGSSGRNRSSSISMKLKDTEKSPRRSRSPVKPVEVPPQEPAKKAEDSFDFFAASPVTSSKPEESFWGSDSSSKPSSKPGSKPAGFDDGDDWGSSNNWDDGNASNQRPKPDAHSLVDGLFKSAGIGNFPTAVYPGLVPNQGYGVFPGMQTNQFQDPGFGTSMQQAPTSHPASSFNPFDTDTNDSNSMFPNPSQTAHNANPWGAPQSQPQQPQHNAQHMLQQDPNAYQQQYLMQLNQIQHGYGGMFPGVNMMPGMQGMQGMQMLPGMQMFPGMSGMPGMPGMPGMQGVQGVYGNHSSMPGSGYPSSNPFDSHAPTAVAPAAPEHDPSQDLFSDLSIGGLSMSSKPKKAPSAPTSAPKQSFIAQSSSNHNDPFGNTAPSSNAVQHSAPSAPASTPFDFF